jgi:2,4-diaminopentanoate dehydrogenase
MSGLRVALWGFGHMNKVILTYLQEKGYKVVAVFGHHDVGKDAGETAGAAHLGVPITHGSDAHAVLAATKPVVAILATRSFLKDLAEPLKILAENQVNVITIGEEAVYSWNTEPELTQELDALFRKNAVTLTGTGYQDAYWIYLASVLVGVTLKTNRLVCHTQFNVDDYGVALCEAHGVGLSPDQFADKFRPENSVPAYVWNSNEALAVRLGWKILKTVQVYEPLVLSKNVVSKSYGELHAGKVNGLKAIVTTLAETKDGLHVEIETH